jgi:hypothetical protein
MLRFLRLAPFAPALLLFVSLAANCQVEFENVAGDHIAITIDGKPFSNFFYGPAYAKPYLAPLRTASGLILTRRWPLENAEGDSHDHTHHRGLWLGFGDINGVNFWEIEPEATPSAENPKVKGKVVLANVGDIKPGKKSGSISMTFDWEAPPAAVLLTEQRVLTFEAGKDIRIIDVDSTFTAKRDVNFGDTKEGFFAIRLADSIAGKNGGLMTNSEGAQTEKDVWGKPADWVDYDGTVDGQKVGIVIFDNPGNLRHPTRWHARDYGLFAANPFGAKDFDKAAVGGYQMRAGEQLRFRYRVIIHPGDYSKKKIAELYAAYKKRTS